MAGHFPVCTPADSYHVNCSADKTYKLEGYVYIKVKFGAKSLQRKVFSIIIMTVLVLYSSNWFYCFRCHPHVPSTFGPCVYKPVQSLNDESSLVIFSVRFTLLRSVVWSSYATGGI